MRSTTEAPRHPVLDGVDQRVFLHGVSWETYEAILAARGDTCVPRITYLEGELELMSPSRDHERKKKLIAALLEAYLDERGLEFDGVGSWTLRSAPKRRGVEPDECYIIGDPSGRSEPDLAIEVEWTAGGLDKLEVYRCLGVREVWMWRGGRIEVFVLRGDRYASSQRGDLLPELDLERLASLLDLPTQSRAVREFRAYLRGR